MSEVLYQGEFLSLVREGHWEYVDRVTATGAAIIAAVTRANNVLLVEQYRVPLHCRTIEMPAGIMGDDPGNGRESHEEAARRELLEETGYRAGRMTAVARGPSSGGLTSEVVTLFIASDLERAHRGGGVGQEDITVHEVPLASVDAWLEQKASAGLLVDPKIFAGLYLLKRSGDGAAASVR